MTLRTMFAAVVLAAVTWPDHVFPALKPAALQSNVDEIYRLTIGECEVIAVWDGSLPLALETLLTGSVPGGLLTLIEHTYPSRPVETSITAFPIRPATASSSTRARATRSAPTREDSSSSLRAAATRPEQIDAILLTHLHGDHAGGLRRRPHGLSEGVDLSRPERGTIRAERSRSRQLTRAAIGSGSEDNVARAVRLRRAAAHLRR